LPKHISLFPLSRFSTTHTWLRVLCFCPSISVLHFSSCSQYFFNTTRSPTCRRGALLLIQVPAPVHSTLSAFAPSRYIPAPSLHFQLHIYPPSFFVHTLLV
jgi:hypothetical protein